MKIDVIICTKNSAKTIERVLKRIKQFIPVNRLIIIDGGSQDDTIEVCHKNGCEIHYDNGIPLGAARNLGLKLAETKIVAFIDSDALITKRWFPKLIQYFKDSNVAVVSNPVIFGYGNPPLEKLYRYLYEVKRTKPIGFASSLVKRSTILKIGGIKDISAYEDIELYDRIEKKGYLWVHDFEVETFHPRSLRENIKHFFWWGTGYGNIKSLGVPVEAFLKSPAIGFYLALKCHPIHIVYYPIIRGAYLLGSLKSKL